MKAKAPNLAAVAPNIANCVPYPPGKPIKELEREYNVHDIIKIASNENPLGASEKILPALQKDMDLLRLYPDAGHFYLREKLAQNLAVDPNELIIGNGSNEIIDLLIRCYCQPGDRVVSCGAAFVAYRVCAQVQAAEYVEAPLNEELVADLDAMYDLCDEKTKIVFLPNPNNPTGTYVGREKLLQFVEKMQERKILLVLDYAYWEYVTADDLCDPMEIYENYSNIVVMHTFSKIYGLAGMRVGYGIAHPDILSHLYKAKMPFNVNNFALVAAEIALDDLAHLKRSYEVNAEGKEYFYQEFSRLGLEYWKSQGNFMLAKFPVNVMELNEKFLRAGVITRPVAGYGLKEHLRISVGTMAENKRFIQSLENFL